MGKQKLVPRSLPENKIPLFLLEPCRKSAVSLPVPIVSGQAGLADKS